MNLLNVTGEGKFHAGGAKGAKKLADLLCALCASSVRLIDAGV